MTPDQLKHIELIQSVVNRLASNSFAMKGWSVTLVVGLFALSAKEANPWYLAVALIPAVCFWFLDAYYLWQERLFRELYDVSCRQYLGPAPMPATFSMDTSAVRTSVAPYIEVLRSPTIYGFHAPLTVVILVVILIAGIIRAVAPATEKKDDPSKASTLEQRAASLSTSDTYRAGRGSVGKIPGEAFTN
jgi:hypothetical protein